MNLCGDRKTASLYAVLLAVVPAPPEYISMSM
jgi:hypothetical protein